MTYWQSDTDEERQSSVVWFSEHGSNLKHHIDLAVEESVNGRQKLRRGEMKQ